jgi:tRNA pseudouridine55 synthase
VVKPQNKFLSSSFHLSGILLIDKPEGPSSAQVVQKVKNILGAKKVGHLGTLDPFASGLLPLGVNEGTKVAEIFLNVQKGYSGVIALGVETDTQDSTGKVLKNRPVPPLNENEIKEIQAAFTGNLLQTPPMFSALKKSGVRLYELARQGQSVPRAPREIQVDQLRLWKLGAIELGFELLCSKGTYIRTLAADMGEFLGCGAHLKSLRRLSCGHLTANQAVPLDEVAPLKERGEIPILSMNQALSSLRSVCLDDASLSRLTMGQQEVLVEVPEPRQGEKLVKLVRLVDSSENLVALAEWIDDAGVGHWRLFRVFSS